MAKKYSGGHIALEYMKPTELLADTAAIGIMAFFGNHAVNIINSVATSSGIYASIHDVIRDKSDGDGLSSYTTRAIRRSAIPGIAAIGLRAATSPAQTPMEYTLDVGATTALYFGGLLLSPTIRNGPKIARRLGKSLIGRLQFTDNEDDTFRVEDPE
jgi:hypothetical protein